MPEPMPDRKLRRTRCRNAYRELLHLLNQRYRHEFVRAERLQADLALVQAFRATRLFVWLQRLQRWLVPAPVDSSPAASWSLLPITPLAPRGKVSLVIPFKDRLELLRDCLSSLRLSSYRNYEVVLVDNGSVEPRTLRFLQRFENRRRWRVVRAPGPFNFARLCNAGAEQATGKYVLFLNNDVVVLTPDWLEQLLIVARQPGVGAVGATLLYPDGTLQHAGMFQHGNGVWDHFYRECRHDHPGEAGELRQVRVVPAVTAACLLMGRARFVRMGGFDEARPVTHNDTDLCRRLREDGLLVAVTPHAQLLHYESLSRGYALVPPEAPASR